MTQHQDTAQHDQLAAAVREQAAAVEYAAGEAGVTVQQHNAADAIGPAQRRFALFDAFVLTGRAKVCRHLLGGPAPSYVFAARPDAMLCGACMVAACEVIWGDRCVECGTQDDTSAYLVARGPIVLMGTTCDTCRDRT